MLSPRRLLCLSVVLCAQAAAAAPLSPACASLKQKEAALAADDVFQSNLILFSAAGSGCDDVVSEVLARGAALEARDRLGRTALALAAKEGRERLAESLLRRGAAVDARAISGATPLLSAAEADRTSVARVLVAHGANVNLAGPNGLTPLMAAAFNGNMALLNLLLTKGADPNADDATGKTALVYAASRGFPHAVARLIDAGVDVNRTYGHGLTALMWAAGYADGAGTDDIREVLGLLVAHGASPDARDDRGKTAVEIARDLGHREVADYLVAQSPAR
jgi:ankyrin repeat protein